MRGLKISIIALVISFGAFAATQQEEATLTKVGQVAPEFAVEQIDGTKFDLAKQRGSVVVLNFFATWCEKCAKEMPFVRELARRTEPSGMVFIGVLDRSKGQTVESVRAFMKENDLPFAAFMDKARTKPAYLGTTIPDLVLIDKAGRVRWHDHPANLAEYTLETLIGEDDSKAEAAVPK